MNVYIFPKLKYNQKINSLQSIEDSVTKVIYPQNSSNFRVK